jgi:hypothetical protein
VVSQASWFPKLCAVAELEADALQFVLSQMVLTADSPDECPQTLRLLRPSTIWKHRNSVVFCGLQPSLALLLKLCRDNAALWRACLSR